MVSKNSKKQLEASKAETFDPAAGQWEGTTIRNGPWKPSKTQFAEYATREIQLCRSNIKKVGFFTSISLREIRQSSLHSEATISAVLTILQAL